MTNPRSKKKHDWSQCYYMGRGIVEIDQLKDGRLNLDPLPQDVFQLHLGTKEQGDKIRLQCLERRLSPSIAVQYEGYVEIDENGFINPEQKPTFEIQRDRNRILVQVPPIAPIDSPNKQEERWMQACKRSLDMMKEGVTDFKDIPDEPIHEPGELGNKYIDKYLDETFGQYSAFIRQWLAVYCYTNYLKLPMLILQGDPSSGKSTFADLVHAIFESLSWHWDGAEKDFTPHAEKKLLIIEENQFTGSVKQYKTIKQYLGAKHVMVNQKWREIYSIKNNMNLILTSNNAISIYLQPEEVDQDETRNKFFVYKFKMPDRVQANQLELLKMGLGNYVRTVLYEEFKRLEKDLHKHRFAIPVPYTKDLAHLTLANEPVEVSLFVDMIFHLIKSREPGHGYLQEPLLDQGILTNKAQRNVYQAMTGRTLPVAVLGKWRHQLRDAKLIDRSRNRFTVNGSTERGVKLTQHFLDKYVPGCKGFKDLERALGALGVLGVAGRAAGEAQNTLI